MNSNIPETMMALVQKEPGGKLSYEKVATPFPGKGEVLIRTAFAPVNPSDLSFLQGSYAEKPSYPAIPGIEGSGIVVATGSGLVPLLRAGKRIACTSTHGKGGSWAEYMVTSAMNVIPVNNNTDLKQAASLIVNPLTALSFIDIAKKGKHNVVANNAAGGALGKMMVRLFKDRGIKLINIVRTEEQKKALEKLGADIVINSSSDDYTTSLKNIFAEHKPTLILDAIGGKQTKALVEYAPEKCIIMPYANLSEEDSVFNPRTLLQQDKKITGFFLGNHTAGQNLIKVLRNIKTAKKLIDSTLTTDIRQVVSPEKINEAIEDYRKGQSRGKIIMDWGADI